MAVDPKELERGTNYLPLPKPSSLEIMLHDVLHRANVVMRRMFGNFHYDHCRTLLKNYELKSALEPFGGWGIYSKIYNGKCDEHFIIEYDEKRASDIAEAYAGDPKTRVFQGDAFEKIKEMPNVDLIDIDANGVSYPAHYEYFDIIDDVLERCQKLLVLTCIVELQNKWYSLYFDRHTDFDVEHLDRWYEQRLAFYGTDRISPEIVEAAINRHAEALGKTAKVVLFDHYAKTHARVYLEIQ